MAARDEAMNEPAASAQRRSRYDSQLPVRMRTASDLLEECARIILDDGNFIGFTELRILGLLVEREALSISEISRDLLVDKAWISRRIKLLADRDLVRLDRHSTDSRIVLGSLTVNGRELFARITSAVTPVYDEIVAGIDEAAAIAVLDRLERNLRSLNRQLRQSRRVADK